MYLTLLLFKIHRTLCPDRAGRGGGRELLDKKINYFQEAI